jgi:hypothetical protein
MDFELSVIIHRTPDDVFAFFRDKDRHRQKTGSPVLGIEKLDPGPPVPGTRYREVVQILPLIRGEICSRITRIEPGSYLEEDFEGAAMRGHLAYKFLDIGNGTRLIQRESLAAQGFLKVLDPIIRRMLFRRLLDRLEGIKLLLESQVSDAE